VAAHSGILMDEMQTGRVESACVYMYACIFVFMHARVRECVHV